MAELALHRDRDHRLVRKNGRHTTSRCLDVPVQHLLHESSPDDSKSPHEVLGPGCGYWWHFCHSHHCMDCQSLEVDEQRCCIGRNVRCCRRMAEKRHKRRDRESKTGNARNWPPCITRLHSSAVRERRLHACKHCFRVRIVRTVHVHLHVCIQVRNCVCYAWNTRNLR